ncbi:unnamed protein product [Parnassius apollo]|uniref:(apollo) hypothetical protein n=1 Tax=Parnassius apollo TaxID=110799 RepID=A0A8S3WPG8_PARAO|nr:unnamed protein product [Parnassius apollo]
MAAAWRSPGRDWSWHWTRQNAGCEPSTGAARPPSGLPHPSSSPQGLLSAGSSHTQQAIPAAGGAHRMGWSKIMNANALRAYFRTNMEETGKLAYRARVIAFCRAEAITNIDERRVRYILSQLLVSQSRPLRREAS